MASEHDHEPPLQYGPVERRLRYRGLAEDFHGAPACLALAEDVDRVRAGVNNVGQTLADFFQAAVFQGGDKDTFLDPVAVGLEQGG
jgi:hypothetical protein